MYRCKYFDIRELVPEELYKEFHAKGLADRLWTAFDDRVLKALDGLRERFGPLTVNTWASGGAFRESGLRSFTTDTGAALSQHKFGRAIDFRSRRVTPKEIYEDLVKSGGLNTGFRTSPGDNPWKLITRVEYYPGITWTHIDVSQDDNEDGSIKVFTG